MTFKKLISSMTAYGSTEEDICMQFIGISDSYINEKVVIAPWWEPSIFKELGQAISFLSKSAFSAIKAWNIQSTQGKFTYIKTGIGAPVLADIILSLGVTACKEIIFIGSAGALEQNINIGDIVIPEYSICGDGVSRYLKSGTLHENDPFGEKAYPDSRLTEKLKYISNNIGLSSNIKIHQGRNFSVDTIFAQFAFLDEIIALDCNVIEMETASAFKAAEITGIPITAIFSVSDNTIQKKSLVSGRTIEEINYSKYVRNTIFPKIIKNVFFS